MGTKLKDGCLDSLESVTDFGPNDEFHCRVDRQFVGSDGNARMFACVAKGLNKQLRRPVDDRRLLRETLSRLDVAFHAHDPRHSIKVPDARLDLRESVQRTKPRSVGAFVFVQIAPEFSFEHQLFADHWQLPTGDDEVPGAKDRDIEPDRFGSDGNLVAVLFQTLFDGAGHGKFFLK